MKHSLISNEVLILTLPILPARQWCNSWYIPRDGLMMREWPYTASNRDELGCTSPPTSRFPSALEMSLGLRPCFIPQVVWWMKDESPHTLCSAAIVRARLQWKERTSLHCLNPCCSHFKMWNLGTLIKACLGKVNCTQPPKSGTVWLPSR